MWLALREGNAVYRLDLRRGTIHHEAGTGKKASPAMAAPPLATLSGPKGIAVGPKGNIYLADTESHSVRMINRKTGRLELLAGDGKRRWPRRQQPASLPNGSVARIFVDAQGAIYVGDTNTHRVRVIRR